MNDEPVPFLIAMFSLLLIVRIGMFLNKHWDTIVSIIRTIFIIIFGILFTAIVIAVIGGIIFVICKIRAYIIEKRSLTTDEYSLYRRNRNNRFSNNRRSTVGAVSNYSSPTYYSNTYSNNGYKKEKQPDPIPYNTKNPY